MNKHEVSYLLALLGDAYGKEITEGNVNAYALALADIPYAEAQQAAAICMRECKFFPAPAEIRRAVEQQRLAARMARLVAQREAEGQALLKSRRAALAVAGEAAAPALPAHVWTEEDEQRRTAAAQEENQRVYGDGTSLGTVRAVAAWQERRRRLGLPPKPSLEEITRSGWSEIGETHVHPAS